MNPSSRHSRLPVGVNLVNSPPEPTIVVLFDGHVATVAPVHPLRVFQDEVFVFVIADDNNGVVQFIVVVDFVFAFVGGGAAIVAVELAVGVDFVGGWADRHYLFEFVYGDLTMFVNVNHPGCGHHGVGVAAVGSVLPVIVNVVVGKVGL